MKKIIGILIGSMLMSCAGFFQGFAIDKAIQDHNCQSVSVLETTPGGGDNEMDSYEMNVCGQRRRYAWIANPSTGQTNVRDITQGRPDLCQLMETARTQNMVRMFYLRNSSAAGSACMDRLLSQGWRIVNQRVAHNGDTTNGWGEEVTFTR